MTYRQPDGTIVYPTPAIDKLKRVNKLDLARDLIVVHDADAAEGQKEKNIPVGEFLRHIDPRMVEKSGHRLTTEQEKKGWKQEELFMNGGLDIWQTIDYNISPVYPDRIIFANADTVLRSTDIPNADTEFSFRVQGDGEEIGFRHAIESITATKASMQWATLNFFIKRNSAVLPPGGVQLFFYTPRDASDDYNNYINVGGTAIQIFPKQGIWERYSFPLELPYVSRGLMILWLLTQNALEVDYNFAQFSLRPGSDVRFVRQDPQATLNDCLRFFEVKFFIVEEWFRCIPYTRKRAVPTTWVDPETAVITDVTVDNLEIYNPDAADYCTLVLQAEI